ncbi:ferric reductase-like transmembrane domain-containing protein [Candidatus Daviesbacteria bacterium]|nr:ferric reductase-like transmembrane domain-containing protein [Candidatus Daviesbacteria bacterium]
MELAQQMSTPHPYHYFVEKNLTQRFLDIGVPLALFFLFFFFYNFGQFNPREMIKTSGLLSITLLGVTLIVGPLSRLFPSLDILKAHRKFWGVTSFLVVIVHLILVYIYYYKFNLLRFVDFSHPKYPGILSGILALVILFLVTVTSNQKALTKLSPKVWKAVQTSSYLAMALAVAHFYLMETQNGVLVIRKLLGQITFVFAILVIVLRLLILFLPASPAYGVASRGEPAKKTKN